MYRLHAAAFGPDLEILGQDVLEEDGVWSASDEADTGQQEQECPFTSPLSW